ncbi:unnamed protein product, partial [Discosporangium mesarthrocarpum]
MYVVVLLLLLLSVTCYVLLCCVSVFAFSVLPRSSLPCPRRVCVCCISQVMWSVGAAGQHEVAQRLLQRMRQVGITPNEVCFHSAMRACAKWGRWDTVELILAEMERLGVGLAGATNSKRRKGHKAKVAPSPPRDAEEEGDGDGGEGEGRGRVTEKSGQGDQAGITEGRLNPKSYAYLIEAYIQGSQLRKGLDVYFNMTEEGRNNPWAPGLKVYQCALKACLAVGDGPAALKIILAQAADRRVVAKVPSKPNRRCWHLAIETLTLAGMREEGLDVLKMMVKSGFPITDTTNKVAAPLLPLPEGEFDWEMQSPKTPAGGKGRDKVRSQQSRQNRGRGRLTIGMEAAPSDLQESEFGAPAEGPGLLRVLLQESIERQGKAAAHRVQTLLEQKRRRVDHKRETVTFPGAG